MEKEKDLNVHRVRSAQAAISDGYRLFAANFGRLLRSSWIAALLYALSMGWGMAYLFTDLMPDALMHGALAQPDFGRLALWMGLMFVFSLSLVLFVCAAGFAPLRQHEQTGTIEKPVRWRGRWPWTLVGRGIVVFFWLGVVVAVGQTVIALLLWALLSMTGQGLMTHSVTFMVVVVVMELLFTVLWLPLLVTSFDQMMASRMKWTPPFEGYSQVARHLGKIVVVAIVVWIVVGVVSAVVQMPAFILTAANLEALNDMARGDAVDMPQPLFWFNFFTFALAGLLQAYLHLSTLFPFYYVWGSIKETKNEKTEK